ncbi:MAG: hypothetical protein U0792_03300 [Gemmataceae bacterium]
MKRGDALRIMEIFPLAPEKIQEQLESALLTRPDLPVKEAVAALAHADDGTVRLATRLLGRVKDPDSSVKKAVGNTLEKWWKIWQDERVKAGGMGAVSTDDDDDDDDYYDDDDEDAAPIDTTRTSETSHCRESASAFKACYSRRVGSVRRGKCWPTSPSHGPMISLRRTSASKRSAA